MVPKPARMTGALKAIAASAAVSAMSGQIQQHHDRVFLVFRVVVRTDADRPDAEAPVEAHRGRVRTPNLERDEAALAPAAHLDDVREQPGGMSGAPRLRISRQVQ